jgi:AGZA family xanthine/uracil permease-like MFS transporter
MGLNGHLPGLPMVVFCFGLLLMIALVARKVPGAILISILSATVLAVILNAIFHPANWGPITPSLPRYVVSAPDFALFGHVNLFGFVDAMGTITGVAAAAGLTDRAGRVRGMGRILLVDGAGAIAGGITGSAPNTVFLESAAGVGEGARTGLRGRCSTCCCCSRHWPRSCGPRRRRRHWWSSAG